MRAGARLADTRTVCPGLHAEPADPQGDAAALDRLALWARRFCPGTAADRSGPDAALGGGAGLVLDTTGADHLWGGEAGMLAAIEGDLAVRGLTARVAVAPTWGAAWGLARFGALRAEAQDVSALLPLPVAALRLAPDTVLLLRRLGLRTVGDLAAIPRLSLARRFRRLPPADNPLIRLDQANGRLAEPLDPPDPPPAFRAAARLPEPVLDPTQNLPALAEALCRDLAAAHQGARLLRLSVWRVDGSLRWIDAGAASATRDPAHVAWLFRERLERIDPGYGFDLIELSAPQTAPLLPDQHDLAGAPEGALSLPQLIDRLSARFGAGRVTRPVPLGSHIPERAMEDRAVEGLAVPSRPRRPVPGGKRSKRSDVASGGNPALPENLAEAGKTASIAGAGTAPRRDPARDPAPPVGDPASPRSARVVPFPSPDPSPADLPPPPAPPAPPRPHRLFDPPTEIRVLYAVPEGPPAQFLWRGQTCRVARWAGPERIAPEWWADRPGTRLRDYYRVEDATGLRLWLYREGLAGDGRGGAPRWFVHGVFA